MPAWLLCRRERPARRDDGHDGGAGARVGPPGVHRLRDVGDGRAVALRKERGQALLSHFDPAPSEPPRVLAMARSANLTSVRRSGVHTPGQQGDKILLSHPDIPKIDIRVQVLGIKYGSDMYEYLSYMYDMSEST